MNLRNLLEQKWVMPAAVGVVTGAVGGVGGYIYGVRKSAAALVESYEHVEQMAAELESRINDVMEQLGNLQEGEKYEAEMDVPASVQGETILAQRVISQEEAQWIMANQNANLRIVPDPDPEPEITNAFDEHGAHDDSWDEVAEMQHRTGDKPYVIHEDEFFEDVMHFKQMTLTYYAGDDILCDDKDVPIYGYSKVVGDLKFGHGSSSKDTVYVRNEELRGEYEITHNPGHYQIEVIGSQAENELMHSGHMSVRKFRDD